MKWDMTKLVEEMAIKCKETEEEFIFETILPHCEDILQTKINKEELNRILLRGVRPKGKWIKVDPLGIDVEAYMCSECKTGDWSVTVGEYKFCPYCGAEMETEE